MPARFIQFNGHQPNPNSLPEPGKRYSTIICLLTHPFSRGSVHAASGDPLAAPAIDPNYFAHPADLELAVHMVEGALALFGTAPLRETVRAPKMPPAAALARGRDGLRDFVRDNCRPVYHPVGTAAMMPREQGGVVDARLRVYGTSGLRVVSGRVRAGSSSAERAVGFAGGPVGDASRECLSPGLVLVGSRVAGRSCRATRSPLRTP